MRRLITVSIEGSLTVDQAHQVAEAINLARRTGKPLVLGGGAVVQTHDLGTQPPKAHVEQSLLARRAPLIHARADRARAARNEARQATAALWHSDRAAALRMAGLRT